MYLPPGTLEQTELPVPFGVDFRLMVQSIEERWSRFFPTVQYEKIKVSVVNPTGTAMPAGASGSMQIDPLWGEAVDSKLANVPWQQPHLSKTTVASVDEVDLFLPPVPLHAQMRKVALKKELERWGFDRVRDMLMLVPCSLFDRFAITAEPGDRVQWDSDYFNVVQRTLDSYWKNTNTQLYVILNIEHRRRGA